MNYIRVCKGVNDKGVLLPRSTDVYRNLDLNHDYYTSAFLYNEEQYQSFKKTGTVAGITDTVTDKLYWDFDSAADLTQAKADAELLCNRLEKDAKFSPQNIALFFSGKKGFQVEVTIKDSAFTPAEVKNICLNLGDGLTTLDRQIYNSNRILRLPLSKHQDTGLYKIPLDYSALSEASIEEIKEEAKNTMAPADLVSIFKTAGKNTLIDTLKAKTPKLSEVKTVKVAYDISEVDWSSKPKFLTPEKFLLSLGFFESGERSHALMILGSTFKSLGFNETQTYHFLKSAAEQQGDRTGEDKFPKGEIYKNIIAQIYSPTWKGGVYSVANDELLQRLNALVPANVSHVDDTDSILSLEDSLGKFGEYARNIDKNTVRSGIAELDKKLRMQTGRLYAILGSPGSGKTSLSVELINNTSKLGEHSLMGSYDMSCPDTIQKLIQRHTKLTADQIYERMQNDPKGSYIEFKKILQENYSNTTFVFKTGQSISELKQTILEREKQLGVEIRLVVVDYLELIQSKFSDPTQASMESIQGLREIAINMNKAVVVMLQPNKMAGTIDEPILSGNAAKGSSSILQAVTAMLTIHRPGYSSRTPENDRFIGIDCVKNRSGALFSIDLHFDGATGNIRSLSDEEKMELRMLRDAKKEEQDDDLKMF
jgi:archaellum biogenesis ATPase FlaH